MFYYLFYLLFYYAFPYSLDLARPLSPDLRRRDPERPQPPLDLPLGGLDLPLLRLNPPPPLDLLAVLAGQVMASG